jgi:hypothetical protein
MKPFNRLCLIAFGCLALSSAASLANAEEGRVLDLVYARQFRLDRPYNHTWRKEQPQVSAGYILVLGVDPDFVRPRQVAEPVLYVGEQTAERINAGVSGRLVIVVPATVDARGEVSMDLTKTPIWFGAEELPERIDAAQINTELHGALQKGSKPLPEAVVRQALNRGGKTLHLPDREALQGKIANVVQRYSPNETDLIKGLKLTSKR